MTKYMMPGISLRAAIVRLAILIPAVAADLVVKLCKGYITYQQFSPKYQISAKTACIPVYRDPLVSLLTRNWLFLFTFTQVAS